MNARRFRRRDSGSDERGRRGKREGIEGKGWDFGGRIEEVNAGFRIMKSLILYI